MSGGALWFFNPGNILGPLGFPSTMATTTNATSSLPSTPPTSATSSLPGTPATSTGTSSPVVNDLGTYNWAQPVEPEVRIASSKVRYYYAELGGGGMQLDKVTYLFNNDSQKPHDISNLGFKLSLLDSNNNVVSEYDNKYASSNFTYCALLSKIYGLCLAPENVYGKLKVIVPGDYTLKTVFYNTISSTTINTLSKKISFGYSVPMSLEATKERISFVEKPGATFFGSRIAVSNKTEQPTSFDVSYTITPAKYTIMSTLLVNEKNGLLSEDVGNTTYSGSTSIDKNYFNPQAQNWIVLKFYADGSNYVSDYIAIKAN